MNPREASLWPLILGANAALQIGLGNTQFAMLSLFVCGFSAGLWFSTWAGVRPSDAKESDRERA